MLSLHIHLICSNWKKKSFKNPRLLCLGQFHPTLTCAAAFTISDYIPFLILSNLKAELTFSIALLLYKSGQLVESEKSFVSYGQTTHHSLSIKRSSLHTAGERSVPFFIGSNSMYLSLECQLLGCVVRISINFVHSHISIYPCHLGLLHVCENALQDYQKNSSSR